MKHRDEFPCFLLKKILYTYVKPFNHLINLSLCTSQFPQILKSGKITRIFKKGDYSDIQNYRPVTVPYGFTKFF